MERFFEHQQENIYHLSIKILQNYSIVRTPVGFYQQQSGLSMSSSLSLAFSNIFVNDLDTKIVKKYIKNKKILSYYPVQVEGMVIPKNA